MSKLNYKFSYICILINTTYDICLCEIVINQILEINKENFHLIMNNYYDEIFYYVYNQIDDIEESKDITQEVLNTF